MILPEREYARSISFADHMVIAPGDIANNLAAFEAARNQGIAGDFLDALMSSAVNPVALSLKFIERVAAFYKTIDQFPAFREWTLKVLSNGTELRFRPTEYLAVVNTTRDGDMRLLLWEAKYRKFKIRANRNFCFSMPLGLPDR